MTNAPKITDAETLKAQVDNSQGCLLVYIPKGSPDEVQVTVGCDDLQLDDLVVGVVGAVGQRLLGLNPEAPMTDAQTKHAIRVGQAMISKLINLYLGDRVTH